VPRAMPPPISTLTAHVACLACVATIATIATIAAMQADAGESAAARSQREPPAQTISIWDGVFTQAQAQRGKIAYTGPCGRCHGYKLDGAPDDPDMLPAPPVAGPKFLRKWDDRTLAALFEYTRATMPENNPSYLSDQEYADVIAYMLAASGAPAGQDALRADQRSLARIVVRQSSR
jgi:mono/diheme cytochrome c family protein